MSNWEEIKLGKYMNLKGGYAFSSNNFTEFGIPIIRISNISNKGIRTPFAYISKVNKSLFSEFELSSNNILIAMSGATIGKNCKIKNDSLPALLNQRVGKFRIIDKDNLDNEFLYYLINTEYFQNELFKDAIGGAQPNISGKQIENITVWLPQKLHQQKIAKILNTIDAVIEKTEHAITKYQAIKKGMMHDLFTRGIDVKTGQLRPSFNDAPELYKQSALGMIPKEWEIEKIYQVSDIRVSNVDKKIYPNKRIVRLCNYMDAYNNDFITNELNFTKGSANPNELSRFLLKKEDVIITKDSETPDDIAIPSVVSKDLNNVVCGYHLAILRPNVEKISGVFLMYYLKLSNVQKYFFRIASGSTRYGLTIGGIQNAKISYPDLEEQKEIIRRLIRIDNLIKNEKQNLIKHQKIKKGLMQDLLTGKVEVKV